MKPIGNTLKKRLALVREEDGIALVLVVLLVALLAGLSATLIDQVTSESGRSAKAVSSQASFEAAEAGIDDYLSKLIDDHLYYTHYVHPAEATRRDIPSGTNVVVSGSCTASSKPAAQTWIYPALQMPSGVSEWSYPNGKDRWCQLSNGYEYDLQITPPSAGSTSTGIISTARPIGSTNINDRRVVQALVRPSSLTDFYRVVDGNVSWGSGASTYGKIYANGNVTHDGDAYANIYATGTITGSTTLFNGATEYTPSTSPTIQSQIKSYPINFSSFLTSLSDISRAAQLNGAGSYLNSAGITGWKLVFSSAGTYTVQSCTSASIATTAPTCGSATTYTVPSNGAIYSQQDVIVSGSVKGRVTVASNGNIVVGGNIAPVTPGTDVLGLDAYANVIIAGYVPQPTFTWSAAVLAQTGTWESDPSSPSHSGGVMNFTGMAATADGGSFAGMFPTRNYMYDSTLLYLSPPWFPVLDSLYETTLFRELPAS